MARTGPPEEKALRKGSESLIDAELLAIVLRTDNTSAGESAPDHARMLLNRFKNLKGIDGDPFSRLSELKGIGSAKSAQLKASMEIGSRKGTAGDPWTLYWYGLMLAFTVLSMDEVAGLHEIFNSQVDFSWVIPGGIATAVFGMTYIRFLWHLPAQTSWLFVLSGCMYIGAAVGMELSTDWYAEEDLLNTLAYNLWNALEEGLEMATVVLFIYALLSYMGQGQDVPVDMMIGEQGR